MSDLQAILTLAGDLTTIAVLLLWIRAERDDNKQLWLIIERLLEIRRDKLQDANSIE